jgi:hypothetical protein
MKRIGGRFSRRPAPAAPGTGVPRLTPRAASRSPHGR